MTREAAEAALARLSEDDLMYDHPVSTAGEPMDPVLFVRWDAIVAALAAVVAPEDGLRAALEGDVLPWLDSDRGVTRDDVVKRLRKVLAWTALAAAPPSDSLDVERLRDFAESVVRQWGYWSEGVGGPGSGGLSTLEEAFDILGWDDPHPLPDARCDEPGCMEQATCGWPTRPGGTGPNGGYRRTCGDHMREYAALRERSGS